MPEIVPMLAMAYHFAESLVVNSHRAKPNSGTPSSHVTPQCPPQIWKSRQDRCGGVEAPILCQSEIGRRIRSVQREVNVGELDVMRRDKELLQDEIRELRSQLQSQRAGRVEKVAGTTTTIRQLLRPGTENAAAFGIGNESGGEGDEEDYTWDDISGRGWRIAKW